GAASARSRTWPTRSSSSPPTRRASSRAPDCPSTAGWACELMGSLVDYPDKGASLGRGRPCLVEAGRTLSYGDVQDLSHRVAGALARDGIEPGAKVGILSSNNAFAFACVFGVARRGAVWCPINPRNAMDENRALLDLLDC